MRDQAHIFGEDVPLMVPVTVPHPNVLSSSVSNTCVAVSNFGEPLPGKAAGPDRPHLCRRHRSLRAPLTLRGALQQAQRPTTRQEAICHLSKANQKEDGHISASKST